ncbi:hypothetical protein ACE1TI_10700 [Alteribacillus sp. JSM 102045]|uniref:hypothetical protein n=1 Tax=Alteribacillus sp. JSM 102045 TaxID=1562101 RepID=UPI0035BF8D57
MDVPAITPIRSDEDSSHFSFTEEGLKWKEHELFIDDITLLRKTSLLSFGSFDELRDDLRTLEKI